MKLETQIRKTDIKESGTKGNIKFGVDDSMMPMLYQVLSQYSNPIGSIVREITTNAFDSHIEAGVTNKAVSVRLFQGSALSGANASFEVEDYGMGLSPERVNSVYSKFLASTKRETNSQHGAFGLGSKSPFSYTDLFTVTTRHDGTEYVYALHKGVTTPEITLLEQSVTDKPNGTKITIDINNSHDFSQFQKEIARQLAYFHNVNYEGDGLNHISNDYTIYQGKNFLYREGGPSALHVCLGNVYYPIDLHSANIVDSENCLVTRCYTPIALKFEIGDLDIIWSRENIEYTDRTKEALQKKFLEAEEELQAVADAKFEDIDSVIEFYKFKQSFKGGNSLLIQDDVLIPHINDIIEFQPKYKNASKLKYLPKYSDIVSLFYKFNKHVKNGLVDKTSNWRKNLKWVVQNGYEFDEEDQCYPIYLTSTKYNVNKNKFLNYEGIHEFVLILNNKKDDLEKRTLQTFHYHGVLDFAKVDDEELKQIKGICLEVLKHFKQHIKDYDAVEPTQEFKDAMKTMRAPELDVFDPSSDVYDPALKIKLKALDQDDAFKMKSIRIEDFLKQQYALTIYGFQDESEKLEDIGDLLANLRNTFASSGSYYKDELTSELNILKIAKNKRKAISYLLKRSYHVTEFVSKNEKLIRKAVTKWKAGQIIKNALLPLNHHIKVEYLKSICHQLGVKEYGEAVAKIKEVGLKAQHYEPPVWLMPVFEDDDYIDHDYIKEIQDAISIVRRYAFLDYILIKECSWTSSSLEIITYSPHEEDNNKIVYDTIVDCLKRVDRVNPALRRRLKAKKLAELETKEAVEESAVKEEPSFINQLETVV